MARYNLRAMASPSCSARSRKGADLVTFQFTQEPLHSTESWQRSIRARGTSRIFSSSAQPARRCGRRHTTDISDPAAAAGRPPRPSLTRPRLCRRRSSVRDCSRAPPLAIRSKYTKRRTLSSSQCPESISRVRCLPLRTSVSSASQLKLLSREASTRGDTICPRTALAHVGLRPIIPGVGAQVPRVLPRLNRL